MVLIDTTLWIEFFRKRDPFDLEAVVELEEVVTCLPVVQEVLQGFRDEGAYRIAKEALLAMPLLENPLRFEVFEHAVDLFRTARRRGLTIRSSADCLIAACALRNDCEIFHRDRDYTALAKVSRLRERSF